MLSQYKSSLVDIGFGVEGVPNCAPENDCSKGVALSAPRLSPHGISRQYSRPLLGHGAFLYVARSQSAVNAKQKHAIVLSQSQTQQY